MLMNHKELLELGHFVGDGEVGSLADLLDTIDSGVIAPSHWEIINEDGEPDSILDDMLGHCEFASFVEIPQGCLAPGETSGYGLGFTPEFLDAQQVEPVTYLRLDTEAIAERREALAEQRHDLRTGRLEYLLENWDGLQYYGRLAKDAAETLHADPEARAHMHQMIVDYANDTRTFYEILEDGQEDYLREWRGTEPVRFTIEDVQTIYVASMGDISALRARYPGFTGAYVVLGYLAEDDGND